jgi:hypothetical protein
MEIVSRPFVEEAGEGGDRIAVRAGEMMRMNSKSSIVGSAEGDNSCSPEGARCAPGEAPPIPALPGGSIVATSADMKPT